VCNIRAGHEHIGKGKSKECATYGAAVQGHVGVDLRERRIGFAVSRAVLGGAACGGLAQAVPAAASGSGQSCGTHGACIMWRRATATARTQLATPAPRHRARRPATSTGALHLCPSTAPPEPLHHAGGRPRAGVRLRVLHWWQRWRAWPVADRTPSGGAARAGVKKGRTDQERSF